MKKILFTFFVLVSVCIQAREVSSMKDLRPNDTFNIRITLPAKNSELSSVWDFEHGYKMDVDCQVLSNNENSVQVAIKPTRLLVWVNLPDDPYYSAYYDSNYFAYFDNKKNILSF